MSEIHASIEMVQLACFECSCPFFAPKMTWELARKEEKGLHCPNGHEIFWKSREDVETEEQTKASLVAAREEIAELKSQLVELRHRAEMAEAGAGIESPQQCAPPPKSATITKNARGRYLCPHCQRAYATWGPLRNHVGSIHQDKTLRQAMGMGPAAFFPDEANATAGGVA
jgi:hypothetical protein